MDLELVRVLIAGLVPVLIAATKALVPRFPRRIIPLIVPALGAALDYLGYFGGLLGSSRPLSGAILGALGLWLREVIDQLRRRQADEDDGTPTSGAPA
jgi:hypothetical protein